MKKLILHVGIHKTGTSTIQNNFAKIDKSILRKHGYHYPTFSNGRNWLVNHSPVFYSLFTERPLSYHMNIRWGINTEGEIRELHSSYKKQIRKAFKDKGKTTIISGEGISSLSLQGLLSFKKYIINECGVDEIVVICATRDHSSFLKSDVQEHIKGGNSLDKSLLSVSCRVECLYANVFGKLDTVFGHNNINAYKFEDSTKDKKGIFHYFIKQFLPTVNLLDHKERRCNESLSHESIELISYINKHKPFFSNKKINNDRIINDTLAINKLKGSKFTLSVPNALLDKIIIDKNWLEKRYGISYQAGAESFESLKRWDDITLAQLNTIIPKLNESIRSLSISFLRDKATSLEKSNLSLANKMMLIAKRHRPNGPFISKKVNDYKMRLNEGKKEHLMRRNC